MSEEEIICSICLEECKNQYLITNCKHKFCIKCLQTWYNLKSHATCPCCREEMKQEELKIIYNNFDIKESKTLKIQEELEIILKNRNIKNEILFKKFLICLKKYKKKYNQNLNFDYNIFKKQIFEKIWIDYNKLHNKNFILNENILNNNYKFYIMTRLFLYKIN